MSDAQNPYAPAQVEIVDGQPETEQPLVMPENPPGIARIAYMLGYFLVRIILIPFALIVAPLGSELTLLVLGLLELVAEGFKMILAAVRLRNMGYHWAWCFASLFTLPSVCLEAACCIVPPNYRYHKQWDTGSKVGIALIVGGGIIFFAWAVYDPSIF